MLFIDNPHGLIVRYLSCCRPKGCIFFWGQNKGMKKLEIREAMMKAAQEEIERILAWNESQAEIRFSEMEDQILAARKKIGERMLEEWINLRESERNAEIPENKRTGKRMHPKGIKKKSIAE